MTRFGNVGIFIRETVWLRMFSSQTFFRNNTPIFSNLVILHTYSPMKMEQTKCSETSAYKIQAPGNYPEESIQHSEHGESLKSRILYLVYGTSFRPGQKFVLGLKILDREVQEHQSLFLYKMRGSMGECTLLIVEEP